MDRQGGRGVHRTGACYTDKLTFFHGSSIKVWGAYYTNMPIIFQFLRYYRIIFGNANMSRIVSILSKNDNILVGNSTLRRYQNLQFLVSPSTIDFLQRTEISAILAYFCHMPYAICHMSTFKLLYGSTMQCNSKTYYQMFQLSAYVPNLCPQSKSSLIKSFDQ